MMMTSMSAVGFQPSTFDYSAVTMECVSEHNWNQDQENSYRSASAFFVGSKGNISWDGQTSTCRGWSSKDNSLTMYGTYQPRLFFKDSKTQDVLMIDMTKDKVSWMQDVSQLGKTFNGALYTSWVSPAQRVEAGEAAKYYCDANDGTGNNLWCPEMDLGEANRCGLRTTSHPVTDILHPTTPWEGKAVNCFFPLAEDVASYKADDGSWKQDADRTNLVYCGMGTTADAINLTSKTQSWVDHFGNALYATSKEAVPGCGSALGADHSPWKGHSAASFTACDYGPGSAYTIDTTRPYEVTVTFDWNAATSSLNSFKVNMTQGAGHTVTLTRPVGSNPAGVNPLGGFGKDGKMGLLAQLWTSPDMSWLSGKGCTETNDGKGLPAVKDVSYTIWDIKVNSDLIHFTEHDKA